jgi:ribosomal protein S18 acetylase RimI-like enzyme
VLAAPASVRSNSTNGPRPINLAKDVGRVLILMDAAFGPIRDWRGQRILGNRVSHSYGAPFALRLSMVTKGFIPGFVWEENGRLVGNVSLLESDVSGRYLIANVAVDPEYRRRGIARGLIQEAVGHIQDLNGRTVILQVEETNEPAIRLYESFGFVTKGVMKKWEVTASRLRFPKITQESRAHIRPINRGDWRAAYKLDAATVDPDLNWPAPPGFTYYRVGLWRAVGDFLNGRKIATWVSDATLGTSGKKRLTGLATLYSEWGRPHQLRIRIDSSWRDKLAAPLMARALSRAKRLRGGVYRVSHPAEDEVLSEVLKEMNFKARRALTVMKLQLRDV